ncbi:MAG: RING finger protein [Promethearchaeota archaeon]
MKEDVYFYLDLTKELLKKKEIIKAIKYYIQEKNKINIKGHYSLLVFQTEGNPVFITDKKDAGIITNSIEENWKKRPKDQSFFENGLFYIFSYIAETVRKKSKFNRIIVITDTPSDLSEDYQEALFNLVSVIKNFPTFIDIIRISESDKRFFSDDVKLNMLASDTKGGIFYIQDRKEFFDIIKKLIKTKQSPGTFIDQPDLIKISEEDYAFYHNLAKPLKKVDKSDENLVCYFCKEELCPVCSDIYDIPSICEDCNTSFHNCCLTNYTINHNIGIPNILRCPSCDVLLRIDEDEIIEVSGEVEVSTVKYYMKREVLDKVPINLPKVKPLPTLGAAGSEHLREIKLEPIPMVNKDSPEREPIKTIRIGGFFGKVYTVKKVRDKIVYERVSKQTTFTPNNSTIKKERDRFKNNNTSQNSRHNRAKKQASFVICQQCGTQINPSKDKNCPNCGYRIT